MNTPFKRIRNQLYQWDVLVFTFATESSAEYCLSRLNSNYQVIVTDTALGESSKDIAIKCGCIEFHGIYLPRPVVRF